MPKQKRFKTKYAGVYYIEGTRADGQTERIYYILYRRNGRLVEEKAGRQFQDDMTPARASGIRATRIEGKNLSNKESREQEATQRKADELRWTIGKLWEEYQRAKADRKGLQIDGYRYANFIGPHFADKEPKDILSLDIERLKRRDLKEAEPKTVYNVLELLRRLVNFGQKRALCPALPFVIEMPRVNNEKTEDLTPEQMRRLLEALEEDSHTIAKNLIKLVLFTGMRRGECFRLQWDDVDFDRGFICLRDPKGGPDQKIPINESARVLLHSHPRTESPFVFPGRDGGQRISIRVPLERIRKRAGLPADFRPLHGLRHVYASMLASSGQVDMYTLQKLLTHKSPQMTQRYAHLRDEALKRASDLAGNIIGQMATWNPTKILDTQGKPVTLKLDR
jgi:integrase